MTGLNLSELREKLQNIELGVDVDGNPAYLENQEVDQIIALCKDYAREQLNDVANFKPKILPKTPHNIEAVKQGINFYGKQLRKHIDQANNTIRGKE